MIVFLENRGMKKVLLTTMFGALFTISSLSANAEAGSLSGKVRGNVGINIGAVFFSNTKANKKSADGEIFGLTAIGGATITPAVGKDENIGADNSIIKTPASISSATVNMKKKPGIITEIVAGASYWFTDYFGLGLDLGLGVTTGKIEDMDTKRRSKITNTLSLMPTVSCMITDNVVVNFGAGISWTKVKDLGMALSVENITKDEVANDALTFKDCAHSTATTADAAIKNASDKLAVIAKNKFIAGGVKTKGAATKEDVLKGVEIINDHNTSVLSVAQRAYKKKAGFAAQLSVGYLIDENNQLSLGYKYTDVKAKVKNDSQGRFKTGMHAVTASYTYNF